MTSFGVPADDDLGVPKGHECVVTAIPNKDGVLVDHIENRSGNGSRIVVQLRIADGDYKGDRASYTGWPPHKGSNKNQIKSFKADMELITGNDYSGGAQIDFADIVDGFENHSFRVRLDEDDRGYTVVRKMLERVEKIEVAAPKIQSSGGGGESFAAPAAAPAADDDDLPF